MKGLTMMVRMNAKRQSKPELFRCPLCTKTYEGKELVLSKHVPNLMVPPCRCVMAGDATAVDHYLPHAALAELYAQAERGARLQHWAEGLGIKIPDEDKIFQPQDRSPERNLPDLVAEARAKLLMMGERWTLPLVVRKLMLAAEHLVSFHSSEAKGYEDVEHAIQVAATWLIKLGFPTVDTRPTKGKG